MGKETECPICYAYIPVDDDVRDGDLIYCSFCGTQLMIRFAELRDAEGDDEKIDVDEHWD